MNNLFKKISVVYRRLFSPSLNKNIVKAELKKIDTHIVSIAPQLIPELFVNIPLDTFGKLLLDIPPEYPNIKSFLPSMASEQDQDGWTGNHGWYLALQSVAFIKSMVTEYKKITANNILDANVLDFGCGWGRLIRLLYKHIPHPNIYGVDPSQASIDRCRSHGVKANLAISSYVPNSLPLNMRFDLIFAFSVFTHLSQKSCKASLITLRNYITDNGLLVITIRPRKYWLFHEKRVLAQKMLAQHDRDGFAFAPYNGPIVDGEIVSGDTSISIDYLTKNFKEWKIIKTLVNMEDPYQTLVFLRPN